MKLIINQHEIKQLPKLSVKNYNTTINQFNKWISSNGLTICADSIKTYWQDLQNSNLKPSTLMLKREAIRQSLKKQFKNLNDYQMLISIDEFFKNEIKQYKINKTVNQNDIISKEELNKLIDEMPIRLKLVVKSLALTGVRISELLSLRWNDGKKVKSFYHFSIIGKGSKQRTIFIPVELVNQIKTNFGGSDYLFVNKAKTKPLSRIYISSEIKRISMRVLMYSISSHHLRHYYISTQIKNGKDIKAISSYVGHNDTSLTLKVYCHNNILSANELTENII
jgi:site-specific recombinase XerD